jgi:hypothetical protein
MVKLDGAWRTRYAQTGWGTGFVVLRKGRLLGCDNQYAYEGTYQTVGGHLTAHLEVEHYAGEPRSIFGGFGELTLVQYVADLTATEVGEKVIAFDAVVNGNPNLSFKVRLERLMP